MAEQTSRNNGKSFVISYRYNNDVKSQGLSVQSLTGQSGH